MKIFDIHDIFILVHFIGHQLTISIYLLNFRKLINDLTFYLKSILVFKIYIFNPTLQK